MAAASHAEATTTGLNHRKILMWAFLASECMFFATLISTYMVYRHHSLVPPYPEDIISIPVTSVSTFVLLTSSLAMVLALAALQRGDIKRAKLWILATAGFGTTFLMFQVYEFNQFFHEGLSPKTNIFGSTFFTLTGTHGAHVTIGVIWLISLFFATVKGKLKQENSLSLEIAGLYWHFVDIVWIVIFTLVYLIGGNDSGPHP
jgi:heme/copper-type cytochrome/quinol oxidase subunit 3